MEQDWIKVAGELRQGAKTRIQHDCGSGKTLVVNNLPKGLSCYCHRCHFTDFVWKANRTFKDIMKQRRDDLKDAASIRGNTELPKDFTLDIPGYAMIWLLKGGISPFVANKHNIGWSDKYQRVVLPVYNNNNLVFYQMRAIHKHQTIKYLNPSVNRDNILFKAGSPTANTDRVIVTEDILSAIRVSRFIPTVSALGTKLSQAHVLYLSQYKLVSTWLDPDTAGIVGAKGMRKQLSLITDVTNIATNADPKNLTNSEIQTALGLLHD